MGLYERKIELFMDYCHELNAFRTRGQLTKEAARDEAEFYVNTDKAKWINIFDEDELAGFVIIGKKDGEKLSGTDYSIAQAYIAPGHRLKGLMTSTAGKYLRNHPGKWSMLILDDNSYAIRFWNKLFKDNGFKTVPFDQRGFESRDSSVCFVWERHDE